MNASSVWCWMLNPAGRTSTSSRTNNSGDYKYSLSVSLYGPTVENTFTGTYKDIQTAPYQGDGSQTRHTSGELQRLRPVAILDHPPEATSPADQELVIQYWQLTTTTLTSVGVWGNISM